jgi:hypothetical protein
MKKAFFPGNLKWGEPIVAEIESLRLFTAICEHATEKITSHEWTSTQGRIWMAYHGKMLEGKIVRTSN